jgi:hypothetical protein
MKQNLVNILVIFSVLATGAGLALPGMVKWWSQESLSKLDATVLLAAAMVVAWGGVCGARFFYQLFIGKPARR